MEIFSRHIVKISQKRYRNCGCEGQDTFKRFRLSATGGLQTHGDGLGIIIYIIGDGLWLLVDSLWYLEGRCGYLERVAVQLVIREGLWILRDRLQVSRHNLPARIPLQSIQSPPLLSIQNPPQAFRVHQVFIVHYHASRVQRMYRQVFRVHLSIYGIFQCLMRPSPSI